MRVWSSIAEQLKEGKNLCLMVVLESLGSSPGRQGFKMMISTDGTLQGSIGGGFMEHKLVELAKSLLVKGSFKPFIKRQIHRSEVSQDRSGMICSGEQSIGFYFLNAADLEWVEKIVDQDKPKTVLQFDQNGISYGSNENPKLDFHLQNATNKEWNYQEQTGWKNTVYIIGGGHVGLALSKTMKTLDFYVKICDDRKGLNTMERNHFAHQKDTIRYQEIGQWVEEGNNAYIVLMSFGYRKDELVLKQLLGKNFKYFGVMGSIEKMKTLLLSLEKDGFSPDQLKKLHTPIGLHIQSKTPEEIAISIAAEIIKIKNKE